MYRYLLILPLFLAACHEDETVSGYTEPDVTYGLIELDGRAFGASATISFPETGRIRGAGLCNSFNASQNAPYP